MDLFLRHVGEDSDIAAVFQPSLIAGDEDFDLSDPTTIDEIRSALTMGLSAPIFENCPELLNKAQ